jgi:hypothetical protein
MGDQMRGALRYRNLVILLMLTVFGIVATVSSADTLYQPSPAHVSADLIWAGAGDPQAQ